VVIHIESLEWVLVQPLYRFDYETLSVECKEPKSAALFCLFTVIAGYAECKELAVERNFSTRDSLPFVIFRIGSVNLWFLVVNFLGINECLSFADDNKEEILVQNSREALQVGDWLAKLL